MQYTKPATIARPKRPENIAKWEKADGEYTKMSIFFDENFKEPDRNDELCYMYLYFIYYMLACKGHFFIKFEDYDQYAMYAASTIYVRFLNKQKRGEEVESVLNYAKGSYFGLKVAYQNENFREVINPEVDDSIDAFGLKEYLRNSVAENHSEEIAELFLEQFDNLPKYLKAAIRQLHIGHDKLLVYRLYISCLLSFINKLTLSNKVKARIAAKQPGEATDMTAIKNIQKENAVILWHLPETYTDLVRLAMNMVKVKLSKELNDAKNSFDLDENVIDSIIKANYMDELGYSQED